MKYLTPRDTNDTVPNTNSNTIRQPDKSVTLLFKAVWLHQEDEQKDRMIKKPIPQCLCFTGFGGFRLRRGLFGFIPTNSG
jgi:hypothetical protein